MKRRIWDECDFLSVEKFEPTKLADFSIEEKNDLTLPPPCDIIFPAARLGVEEVSEFNNHWCIK